MIVKINNIKLYKIRNKIDRNLILRFWFLFWDCIYLYKNFSSLSKLYFIYFIIDLYLISLLFFFFVNDSFKCLDKLKDNIKLIKFYFSLINI